MEAIDLEPGTGKPHVVGRGDDAAARAMAVEHGMKWKCSRVNAWVNIGDCIARYVQARDAQPSFYCACLECASIDAHLRKNGISPTPTPQPKQQESVEMATPAKKLEVVQAAKAANPFATWNKYERKLMYNAGKGACAVITKGHVLFFSAKAVEQHQMTAFASVDVFVGDGKIGMIFRNDDQGELSVTRKTKTVAQGLNVSFRGVVKHHGLEAFAGKRVELIEHGPGVLEMDFSREVGA